jgi:streptogramin lyase
VVDAGILNPGEEMVVLAKPSPPVTAGTYDRAVFATPSGAVAKVIFRVNAYLYVLDRSDRLAYRYLDDGTYLDLGLFDNSNADAQGVTTDGTGFWTADATDDEVYEFASNFALGGTWNLNLLNADAQGITTDGSSMWVVDGTALNVFRYDTAGVFASSFPLEAANAAPTGITTDGSSIWIVDGGSDAAYKYALDGTFDSSFALATANADPTGITTNGSNIWVVDRAAKKIYTYEMDGTYVAGADITLHNDNADAQGITIRPR